MEEINSRFMISEYQYQLDTYLANANRKSYQIIYEFIKNWLEINNIKIKSLTLINNIAISKLPSLKDTYYYYDNNYNKVCTELKIDDKDIKERDSYMPFFKFLRKILDKINYILLIRQKYLTIKSR